MRAELNKEAKYLKYLRAISLTVATGLGGVACSSTSASQQGSSSGCAPFRVYSQNRWDPLGTAVRPEPNVLAPEIKPSYAGDDVIAVNGWFHYGTAVYPTNTPPWNNNIWYRLADRPGYVDYAGVRGAPTEPDPTGLAYGGDPPPLPPDCEGIYTPTN